MEDITQADERIMTLVELALSRPEAERESFLRSACSGDTQLFDQAWEYVQWENRMKDFLVEPLYPPAEREPPFQPGQVLLRRFLILREVARGGMGIVWEAFDEALNRRVAIKCAKAGFRKQLRPEVSSATQISHPNVCKIFEIHSVSTDSGEVEFISMEFLEGETLAERLRRAALPKKERANIAHQLCAGLAEAHRNRVIHGDLKSNNVILTTGADGMVRAVITDFGLAAQSGVAGRTSSSARLAGTPEYMAPELWKGEKISVASDIYALGVILRELLSAVQPAQVRSTAPTVSLDHFLNPRPQSRRGRWNRVVARCLDSTPARRFRSAGEVALALGPSRLRARLTTAAAVALIAAGVGGVVYQTATAPAEIVRLQVSQFDSDRDTAAVARSLLRQTSTQLARFKSNRHTAFAFLPAGDDAATFRQAGARHGITHILHGTLRHQKNAMTLHAYVMDLRSGLDIREWAAEYKPEELQYAPIALAAVVTGALHLPSPPASVNLAARNDYLAGLAAERSDSKIDAALESLQRAVAEDPASPLAYAALAEAQWFKYADSGERLWLDHATESVRQAQIRNGDLPETHRVAGLLEFDAGHYEQATIEYLRAIELDPANGDAYRRLGMVYAASNQGNDALAAFHQSIVADPKQPRNYTALGAFFYDKGRYKDALGEYRKAVELAPGESLLHHTLATDYHALGMFPDAERELRWSIRLRQTSSALHALGLVLIYEQRDREAISFIETALRLEPANHLYWTNLGTAYRHVRLRARARAAYTRGLNLAELELAQNPRDAAIRAHLAYLCAQLGDRHRASSEIAQALRQAPSDSETRSFAVCTYAALGVQEKAVSVLSTAPAGVLADVSRWPDLAGLRSDPRFLNLLAEHSNE